MEKEKDNPVPWYPPSNHKNFSIWTDDFPKGTGPQGRHAKELIRQDPDEMIGRDAKDGGYHVWMEVDRAYHHPKVAPTCRRPLAYMYHHRPDPIALPDHLVKKGDTTRVTAHQIIPTTGPEMLDNTDKWGYREDMRPLVDRPLHFPWRYTTQQIWPSFVRNQCWKDHDVRGVESFMDVFITHFEVFDHYKDTTLPVHNREVKCRVYAPMNAEYTLENAEVVLKCIREVTPTPSGKTILLHGTTARGFIGIENEWKILESGDPRCTESTTPGAYGSPYLETCLDSYSVYTRIYDGFEDDTNYSLQDYARIINRHDESNEAYVQWVIAATTDPEAALATKGRAKDQKVFSTQEIVPQYVLMFIGNHFVNRGQRRAHYRLRMDRGLTAVDGTTEEFNGVALLEDMERRYMVNNQYASTKNQKVEPLGRILVGERADWTTEPSHGAIVSV